MNHWIWRGAVVATIAIVACVSDVGPTSKCMPGQQFTCTCPNGQVSYQTCNQSGNDFTPCLCGTEVDSGKDYDSSVSDGSSVTDSNVVDSCTPLTKDQACTNPSDAGLPYCGNHSDNCGGTINCGSPSQCGTQCVSGSTCLTAQVCGHDGTCNWQGYEMCSTQSDLCGGSINCGTCNYGTCLYGKICACGRSSSNDFRCSGGTSHAHQCQFGGSLSSPCVLVDSINHIYCCP